MGLRFEAWTLPWSATFERKIADLPVVAGSASGTVRFNDYGEASIGLPPDYSRVDDIISDTTGSLIRVYDGTTIVQEFLAERVERSQSDDVGVVISGGDLSTVFDRVLVYPYDYPTSPSNQLDHIYGGTNVLTNGGLEDSPVTPLEYELVITATGGTFTITDGTDTTSAIAYNATAATIATRIETDLAAFTDILVSQQSGTYLITYVTPAYSPTISLNTGSLTGGTATLSATQDGGLSPSPWTIAGSINADLSQAYGYYQNFGVSDVVAHSGSFSLLVDPGTVYATQHRNPGAQQVVSVKPGYTYQASVWIYPTSGTDEFRFGIFGEGEEVIALDSNGLSGGTYTASTWTQISIANVTIPAGVDRVILRVQCTNGPSNPSTFYIDDAELIEGLPASTVGTIVTDLMDDASTDHSGDTRGTLLTWIDYTGFDGTNDSGSTAWAETISFTAWRGMSYGQVFDQLVELGYEWQLTPKATPSGGLTHDLSWYEPGGRDSAPETAVNTGQGITAGAVIKRIPAYTAVLAEGANGLYVEDSDATAVSNFGRMESYYRGQGLNSSAALTLAGDAHLLEESTNRTAVQVNVVADPGFPRPLVDYKPGDTIYFQLPPALAKTSRRVRQVTWTNTEPPTYQVTGSRVFDRESGAWEAIRKILRRFRPFEDEDTGGAVTLGGGGGGMSTVLVAAADSLDIDKAKADFVCSGVNDQDTIQTAIDLVDNAGGFTAGGGVVWLAAGTYNVEVPASGAAIDVKSGITLRGFDLGSEAATYLQPTNLNDPGSGAEVIRLRTGSALEYVTAYAFYTFPNIRLDPGDTLIKIRHCWLEADEGPVVTGSSNDFVWIEDCYIFANYGSADTTSAIYISGASSDWWVDGCQIQGGYHGIFVDPGVSSSGRINITRNYIYLSGVSGIAWDSPTTGNPYGIIAHNHIFGCGYNSAGGVQFGAIHISSSSDGTSLSALGDSGPLQTGTIITGNRIEGVNALHGMMLDGTVGHQVLDNWVENATQHGIYLLESSDCHVSRNTILWPDGTSDTYDGIHLAAGSAVASNRNYLDNNRVLDSTSGSPRYWRYGINVAGTACYDNIIVGNDLRYASGATGTAIANSAGTATLLSWPAHGTYGDNFT